MYNITYFFKTATPGRNSWNNCIVEAANTDEALVKFAKLATKFVLANLFEMDISIQGHDYVGRVDGTWVAVHEPDLYRRIAEFINSYKKETV
jgi:hypothetical protein